ncbi:MAG: DUF2505 family protein [Acidimicrobiales bacterium]
MQFQLEQRFDAPLAAVEAAFVDPALLALLGGLPNLGRPELLEQADLSDTVSRKVRYFFAGSLSPAASAVLDPERLSWVEESILDRATHETEFRIVPDHYRDRLRCAGTITLHEEGGVTRRVTEGNLDVRFPLVGARVAQAIVSGLRDHAAIEEDVVQRWLDDRSGR